MTPSQVTHLWRYPIKSHGRECLNAVDLQVGKVFPWDRQWAVQHDLSDHEVDGWLPCQHFMRGASTPGLAGLSATLDEASRCVTVSHNDLGDFSFRPDDAIAATEFLEWIQPLIDVNRSKPRRIVSARYVGLTDTDFASISIMNLATNRVISKTVKCPVEIERWRGNIWLDGFEPWQEFAWIGQHIKVGSAILKVRERIGRCLHTAANPRTGKRDLDLPRLLQEHWGHTDFGIYAEVTAAGRVSVGDHAEMI